MTKQSIIERTIKVINQLPKSKAEEISDFADFLIKKYEEEFLSEDICNMVSNIQTFDFLNKEEDVYSVNDLKIIFGE